MMFFIMKFLVILFIVAMGFFLVQICQIKFRQKKETKKQQDDDQDHWSEF